jgi:LPXTG-motif cell wall-anchored protein
LASSLAFTGVPIGQQLLLVLGLLLLGFGAMTLARSRRDLY